MIPRIWLINVILALCLLFVGSSAYRIWTREEPLEAMEHSAESPVPTPKEIQTNDRRTLRKSAYSVIVERTLFRPDRAEFLSETPEPIIEEKPPLVAGRRLNLYGVIFEGDDRKALIDNPSQKSGQPRIKWVRVGQVLENWTVGAIEPESIVLKGGTSKFRIPLYTKQSGESSQTPDRSPSRSSPTVVNTETQRPSSAPKVISSGTGEKRETSGASASKNNEAAGEIETIVTPFGTITKKKGSK